MNALFNNFKCTTKQDIVVCSWKNEIIHLSEPFLLSGDDDVALNFEALAHLKNELQWQKSKSGNDVCELELLEFKLFSLLFLRLELF